MPRKKIRPGYCAIQCLELPSYRSVRRIWHINDDIWELCFTSKMPRDEYGQCDPSKYKITIRYGLNRIDFLDTLIHELAHAIEFSYEIDIQHALIHRMEAPIRDLIIQNLFYA